MSGIEALDLLEDHGAQYERVDSVVDCCILLLATLITSPRAGHSPIHKHMSKRRR